MNDSLPTTDWSSDTLKAEGLALIQQQHPELLLDKKAPGSLIEEQAKTILEKDARITAAKDKLTRSIDNLSLCPGPYLQITKDDMMNWLNEIKDILEGGAA